MLFSYCKRGQQDSFDNVPFNYYTNTMLTPPGFGKAPVFCRNINVPFVHNRGVPKELLEFEGQLRGQDRSLQPFCSNPANEPQIEFSTLEWLHNQPIPKGPIPCAPSPIIQVKTYGENLCAHVPGVRPCGERCGCSSVCQCKEYWREKNMTRPQHTGTLRMSTTPGCKII